MSIRSNALIDHKVLNVRDARAILARLSSTLPALALVADYWRATDPEHTDATEGWTSFCSSQEDYLRFVGPSGFSIVFGKLVARVQAPCRWSGFVTIDKLQRVHAAAFWSIANALEATRMILAPEYNAADQVALFENGSLDDCIKLFREQWGEPQSATEIVTADPDVYLSRRSPAWFIENLSNSS